MSHILSVSDRRRKCQASIYSSALLIVHPSIRYAYTLLPSKISSYISKIQGEKYAIRKLGLTTSRPGKSLSEPEMHLPLRPPQGHFLFFASANVKPSERASERGLSSIEDDATRSVGSDVLSAVQEEKAFWRKIVAARPTDLPNALTILIIANRDGCSIFSRTWVDFKMHLELARVLME